jgi:hypothetical protein
MHVHDRFHMFAERLHRRRTEGEVRHEMAVHHVHMDPVGALILDRPDLAPEIGEIGRQDGWCDLHATVKAHEVPSSMLRAP